MTNGDNVDRPSILMFSPYSGIVEHSRLEYSVIERLANAGAQVDVLKCRGALPVPCTTMDSVFGPNAIPTGHEVTATCRQCVKAGHILTRASGVKEVFMEDVLDAVERAECHEMAQQVTTHNWQDLVVEGVAVGRHAAYVPLIRAKATSPDDLVLVWDRYLAELEASLLTLRASRKMVDRCSYDVAVTFGGLYGPERVFHRVTTSMGLKLVILEGSALSQEKHTVTHAYSSEAKYFHAVFDSDWKSHRNVPLDGVTAERVRIHHEALLDSSNPLVYSTQRNSEIDALAVSRALSIPDGAPVLLFLVSSPDEEVSREFSGDSEPALGEDSVSLQRESVDRLIRFARENPNVHIVIRLHPRLFGDHRSDRSSPALRYYSRLASESPKNVHINHPDQGLSLYDLVLIVDAGVVHQSSTALELLALGLPVVAAGPWFMTCPLDLLACAKDASDVSFFQTLEAALRAPASLSRVQGAYRWWGFVSNFNRMPAVKELGGNEALGNRQRDDRFLKGRPVVVNAQRRLKKWTPTPLKKWFGLRMRVRQVERVAKLLSQGECDQRADAMGSTEVFWSVSSGTNVITNLPPMSDCEEQRFLARRVLDVAQHLNIDAQSGRKLGEFISSMKALEEEWRIK